MNVRVFGIESKSAKPFALIYGNSTETKPVKLYCGGSKFFETDTDKQYRYDDVDEAWYEVQGSGMVEVETLPTDNINEKVVYHLTAKDGDFEPGYYVYDGTWKQILNDKDSYPLLKTADKTLIGAINELASLKGFVFKGYVSGVEPTGANEGDLWYEGTVMPTTFPINVKVFDGTSWSTETTEYTPAALDMWANLEDEHGYYWFGNAWNMIDLSLESDYGLPVSRSKIADYVWELEYENLDYGYAKKHIDSGYSLKASCTAIYKNGLLGRNFDWNFNKEIEAVVRTAKTVSICGGLPNVTEAKMADGTVKDEDLKLLPFYVRDGMNSNGLSCCINVVPALGNTASVPTVRTDHVISAPCLCRYILDNFDNALEACQTIQQYVQIVFMEGAKYEVHYMIADKESCYYLEVVNNAVVFGEADVMTNFHIDGVTFGADGKVHTPEDGGLPHQTQNVDEYGEGLERYNDMVDALPAVSGVDDVFNQALDTVLFTKAYTTTRFYTEFVDEDAGLTVDSTVEQLSVPQAEAQDYYDSFVDDEARRADGKLWHTTHSSAYDIANNILKIKFNEDTVNVKTYTLPVDFNDCFTVVDGKVCAVYESED